MTTREAKEYLITQIVAEANRQGKPLEDIERRMLYYTELAWMPEDFAQLNEAFQQSGLTDAEYEEHIGRLVSDLKRSPGFDAKAWKTAVKVLSAEDHYLLVLLSITPSGNSPSYSKIFLVALGSGVLVVLALFLYARLFR